MGNCCSSPSPSIDSPPSPRTGNVSQQPQLGRPDGQTSEPRRDVSRPQGSDATHEPADLAQPGETSIRAPTLTQSDGNTSQKLPPRSGRLKSPSHPHRSTSAYPSLDNARVEPSVTSKETSQTHSHRSGGSKHSSSRHDMARSASTNALYDNAKNGTSLAPGAASSSPLGFGRVHGHRPKNGVDSAPDPRLPPRPAALRGNNTAKNTAPIPSTMREVLPDGFRFRILVLGKNRSGKSSLINAVFNVDMAAASGSQLGNTHLGVGFDPDNSPYLAVHEGSAFESGDAQSLQTIRDFISYRTGADCADSEKLHAIWVCVPMSDAITRGLGEGVEEILRIKIVPVIIVFTKFDVFVSQILSGFPNGDTRYHKQATAMAHARYTEWCYSIFHKKPEDLDAPVAIFSNKRRHNDHTAKLTATTHTFITANSDNSTGQPTSSQVRYGRPPITPVILAWSAAQRVDHDIIIQASIEIGRKRYWRNLGSSPDFTNRTLENCVNVIHADIIDVWNFDDREGYLSSKDFIAEMSHLVGDLAGSLRPHVEDRYPNNPDSYLNGTVTHMAQWMHGPYQNNNGNIRCIMAYIVDLTVILHGLFVSARNLSATKVQSAMKDYAKTSDRNRIHGDIQSFVGQTPNTYHDRDTILEKIIDLIKQNCERTRTHPSQDSS